MSEALSMDGSQIRHSCEAGAELAQLKSWAVPKSLPVGFVAPFLRRAGHAMRRKLRGHSAEDLSSGVPISTYTQTAGDAFRNIGDYASGLVSPTVRLGVTGLARSGKTVFITALVHNLIASGRLPF